MKHFRKLVFVMGVFSILALLPKSAVAQEFSQATPGGGSVEHYGNFSFNPATVNWKSKIASIPLVEQRLAQLDAQLASLFQGSPAYFQADVRRAYYKLLLSHLEADSTVRDSVIGSGKQIADQYNVVPLANTVVAEAAELLTN